MRKKSKDMKKEAQVSKNSLSGFAAWKLTVKNDFHINKSLYIMVLPAILFFILFSYLPMYGAIIAFKDYQPYLGFMDSPWAGFRHFKTFFNSPYFSQVMINTLRISFTEIVFSFPTPIILALLINEMKGSRYAKLVQNVTYLPHFISLVVICGMIKTFTMDTGVINSLLSVFGFEPKSLLNYPEYFIPTYVISGIWQGVGWNSVVYIAALTSVDEQLYEAAMIDGAGKWKQLIHVTIPCIVPTIVTMLILKLGGVLNVGYEKIILMYNDSTKPVAEVISSYVYQMGLMSNNWSYSAAVGLFNSVINCLFLIVANQISKKTTEVGLW